MKRIFESARTLDAVLTVVLALLVTGSGVSLLHAFAQIA